MKTIYKTYRIYYLNPHILGDELRPLKNIKARSVIEANKKASRELESTGMLYMVKEI